MSTKLDIRQSISHDTLEQLVNATGQQGDAIFRAINEELTVPLRLEAAGTDRVVSVGDILTTNMATGRTKIAPPINGVVPLAFVPSTVTFPASNGLDITFSTAGSTPVALTCANGQFVYVLLYLDENGDLGAVCGTPGAEGTITVPGLGSLHDVFTIGYVKISNGQTVPNVIDSITQNDLTQFNGGGSNPGGITNHDDLVTNNGGTGSHATMTSHIGASTDVHGTGVGSTVVGTTSTQVLTNKDIDGGTASNTSRITLPKDTKANLDLLTRKEGTLVYGTDTKIPYYDDGTALQKFASAEVTAIASPYYVDTTVEANKELVLLDTQDGWIVDNTWAATGNINLARGYFAGAGTQNAALNFAGAHTTADLLTATEKFNGSTWTATGSLINARRETAGAGTQNAALCFGGYDGVSAVNVTEKFSGLTWAAVGGGGLTIPRYILAGTGTQNATLSFGGIGGLNRAEKFNGSTWTATGNLNTSRHSLTGSGIQNAALSFGGYVAAASAVTEKFNGSTWAATGNLNTARYGLAGSGTQNAALSFGGQTGVPWGTTEKFNGSTWTATNFMSTARTYFAGAGTQNAALSSGGYDGAGGYINSTEKFNGELKLYASGRFFGIARDGVIETPLPVVITGLLGDGALGLNVIAKSLSYSDDVQMGRIDYQTAWMATGNLNTARFGLAGAGTQNSALSFGGSISGSDTAVTEKFNTTAWTATGALNAQRSYLAGAGTQNAALSFGGFIFVPSAITEKSNGLIWTVTGSLNSSRYTLAGAGTQNAALSFGGSTGAVSAVTEKFNGTSWTATGSLNTARHSLAGAGSQNAALSFGGYIAANSAITEKFNGSTWAATGSLNVACREFAGAGTQNAALSFGGYAAGIIGTTESFNGQIWLDSNYLNTSRSLLTGSGTQNAALSFGGTTGSNSAVTEKATYIGPILGSSRVYTRVS